MPNYNLIQITQVNKPEFSGYILAVVGPHPSATQPAGLNGQVQYKSGEFFAGSDLYFTGGKFAFGFTTPTADFHVSGKNLTVTDGTGDFSYLFIEGDRVIAETEFGATGTFLEELVSTTGTFLEGLVSTLSGIMVTGFYRSTNPSNFVSETGLITYTGTSNQQNILANQIFN